MEQVRSFPDHLDVVHESCLSVFLGNLPVIVVVPAGKLVLPAM